MYSKTNVDEMCFLLPLSFSSALVMPIVEFASPVQPGAKVVMTCSWNMVITEKREVKWQKYESTLQWPLTVVIFKGNATAVHSNIVHPSFSKKIFTIKQSSYVKYHQIELRDAISQDIGKYRCKTQEEFSEAKKLEVSGKESSFILYCSEP